MEIIYLNGKKMITKDNTHKYLKRKFKLEDFYGENLDSLWDFLSEKNYKMKVVIYNSNDIIINQGDYGINLINLFKDLENIDLLLK